MHHHANQVDVENELVSRKKSRLGIILFFAYAFIYASFVLINVFKPELMSIHLLFGLNLAVTYGFGLILLAIFMGIVYNFICTRWEDQAIKDEVR